MILWQIINILHDENMNLCQHSGSTSYLKVCFIRFTLIIRFKQQKTRQKGERNGINLIKTYKKKYKQRKGNQYSYLRFA